MNTQFSPYPVLFTSLAEIESFKPCWSGWRRILIGQNKTESDSILFPIVDAVKSNNISDICWLLSQRKGEIQIIAEFARLCADSISNFNTFYSQKSETAAKAAARAVANYNDAVDYVANYAADHAAKYAADHADYAADYADYIANAAEVAKADAANADHAAVNAANYAAAAAANYFANADAAAANYDADHAANYFAKADAAAANAAVQVEKNKQFMILCLAHFNPVTKQVELPS